VCKIVILIFFFLFVFVVGQAPLIWEGGGGANMRQRHEQNFWIWLRENSVKLRFIRLGTLWKT